MTAHMMVALFLSSLVVAQGILENAATKLRLAASTHTDMKMNSHATMDSPVRGLGLGLRNLEWWHWAIMAAITIAVFGVLIFMGYQRYLRHKKEREEAAAQEAAEDTGNKEPTK